LQNMAAIPALSERERQIIDGLIKGQSTRTNGTSVAHKLRLAK
jgi:FixJ family two-component response regulator